MQELKKQIQQWQNETFPNRTLASELLKLEEEIKEYEQEENCQKDIYELADIQIVLWGLEKFDSYIAKIVLEQFEYTFDDYEDSLEEAIKQKLEINKARKWEFIDGVYKHVEG